MKTIEVIDLKRNFTISSMPGKRLEIEALKGISFEVEKGTVFGYLGPNGSGKTTTMRILSTLLTPSSGSARVLGFDVSKNPSDVRKKIGLILGGDKGLYGRLTAEENLRYSAVLNHIPKRLVQTKVDEVLTLVNLTEASRRNVEQYSKGMKQRLHIARGLLTDPEVIFMDEPTIGLDPEGAHELRALIPKLIERGKTIILTTHYMSEADELSDRIAIINKGKIIASGTPFEIKRNFSKISVMEVILRQSIGGGVDKLRAIDGVSELSQTTDGPIQKVSIYFMPDAEITSDVKTTLGQENIEYLAVRENTLEEAYLSIVR